MNNKSLFILSLMAFLSPFSASAMQQMSQPIAYPRSPFVVNQLKAIILRSAANGNLNALTTAARQYVQVFGHIDTVRDNENHTPLHIASFNNHVLIIRDLITHFNANPYELTTRGNNALHVAVKYNRYEAMKCLIEEFNVDPNMRNSSNETAKETAYKYHNQRAAIYLENLDSMPGNPMRFSVYQPAANNAPVVQPNPVQPQRPLPAVRPVAPVAQPQPAPVAQPAIVIQPAQQDDYAQMLIEAIDADNLEIAQEFIINGQVELDAIIDLNTGNTALHHALLNNHQAIAIWLVRFGARTNIVNNNGITALQLIQRLPAGSIALLDPAFVNLLQNAPANNAPVAPAPAQPKQQPAQPAANSVQRSDACFICLDEAHTKPAHAVKKTTCCNQFLCAPCFAQIRNNNNAEIRNKCAHCQRPYPQFNIANAVVRQ
jgi:ankyrin repeat protein